MKKFYNFLKREGEREEWERGANPEDIEYAKCQEELGEQLLETVTQVERVIGEEIVHISSGLPNTVYRWRSSYSFMSMLIATI